MVRFTTLFIVLVTGIHPIGVVVGDSVASVEFLLDGQQIGTVSGEPWRFKCDFGEEPLPHELVAIARDRSNREVARARQLINVPRSSSELQIALLGSQGENPSAGRLIIGNPIFAEPEHVVVEFDGIPLEFESPSFIPFPDYDETADHIITAEVEFTDQSAAHAAISFSPRTSGKSGKRLTAISIEVEGGEEPTVESLKNAFQVKGQNVGVDAVERSGGRVVLVRDQRATVDLGLLSRFSDRRYSNARLSDLYRSTRITNARELKQGLCQFVFPIPVQRKADTGKLEKSFWVSPQFRIEESGLHWVTTHINLRPAETAGGHEWQQIADAVVIAALQAAASGRPRVVVAAVGEETPDASTYGVGSVRNFLRALNVPLVVWATSPAAAKRWGSESIIKNPKQFTTAAHDTERMLEKQWIVWLEGLHLPSDVTLHSPQEGIRIAAR